MVERGPDQSASARELIDTRFGVPCAAAPAADGKLRCLPATPELMAFGGYFADDACKVRVMQEVDYERTSVKASMPLVRDTEVLCKNASAASCPGASAFKRVHVYPVAARYSGPVFRRMPDGSCAPSRFSGAAFFSIGPEVRPSKFVEISRSLE